MELDELKTKDILLDYARKNLKMSKNGNYCCPGCSSGEHGEGTSGLTLYPDTASWFCYACNKGGTVIDLIMITERKEQKEAIQRLRELYDNTYDPNRGSRKQFNEPVKTKTKPQQEGEKAMTEQQPKETQEQEATRRDFRNYYKRCQKRINDTDYPYRRGLDIETIKKFNLGYDPDWISPTAAAKRKQEDDERKKNGQQPLPPLTPTPRLIIPLSAYNYLARDIRPDEDIPDKQRDFKKMNEGKDKPFFNLAAVNNPLCFFICEGEIDCMSIEQAGGSCVALGSTVKAKKFGDLLKQRDTMTTGTVIISLDNDPAGQRAADEIENACNIKGLDFMRANTSGAYKDPNEYLTRDRKGFYATIQGIIREVRAEKLAEYENQNSGAAAVDEFMRRPETAGNAIATGFKNLDDFLDGGFCSELVFIGGLSSVGKTTFALQTGLYIATDKHPAGTQETIPGRDVIYFALEQGKNELISKIISGMTYVESKRLGKGEKLAKTNIQLLRRGKWKNWTEQEWETVWKCYQEYQNGTGKHFYIIESPGDISVTDIEKAVNKHIAFTGRVPIIVIDYLQILKSVDPHLTDKQAIDRTVSALKRLSRDKETVVIGLSSFNRESYWQKVNLSAFKESGNLEYSADILMALAPAGIKEIEKETADRADNRKTTEKFKEDKDKKLQLHILKNRNGKTTGSKTQLLFTFHSWFNYFEEGEPGSYLDYFKDGNPLTTGTGSIRM